MKNKKYKYKESDWDNSKSVTVEPDEKERGYSTSIRLSKKMIDELRKIAKRKGGVGYQTLIKIWIAERLEKETSKDS